MHRSKLWLLYDLIGARDECRWDSETDGRSCLQIYFEQHLRGLLNRQVTRLSTSQNLVDIIGRAPKKFFVWRPKSQQWVRVHVDHPHAVGDGGKAVSYREFHDGLPHRVCESPGSEQ